MEFYPDEIVTGTPELDPNEELRLKEQAKQLAAELDTLQNQPTVPQPTTQGSPQQQAQPTGEAQQPQQGGIDIGGLARQTLEGAMVVPAGIADFAVEFLNVLPSKEVPGVTNPFRPDGKVQKLPKFQSDITQGFREISSVIAPTIILSKLGAGAFAGAASASKLKFLQDPFIRWLGPKVFALGVDVGVAGVSAQSRTDHNVTGTLKKIFPNQTGWISNDIATLDSDAPDLKLKKTIVETVGTGVFGDVLEGTAKVVKGIRGVLRSTQWVPESEKAKNWFARNLGKDIDDIEEVIAESAARRSDALDELGEYNFSKNANLDQPMLGVHDLYGYEESGIRSVDPLGIVGAAVDVVRINNNYDSVYGRVGSVVSEAALKFGLEVPEGMETIIKGLASQLQDAGEYGYKTASGRYISHKEIVNAGEELALDFYKMDTPQLKEALKRWQGVDVDTGAPVLKSEAYAGVFKTINMLLKDYADMDIMKAQAYVGTSFAGQVSDMALGARLMDGTAAVDRAQEQILDRLEFLMAQKGMTSYSRGRALNMLNLWNRLTAKGSDAANAAYATRIQNTLKGEKNDTLRAIEKIKAEAKQTINTLREVKEQRPDLLAPLMMAYEFTDGKVDTIGKLNNYVRNSLGVFSKAVFDGDPSIPSTVMRGFWSNLYNSTLSAIGTPIKAGVSNIALLAERPITQAAGALINGDMATFRKGWYQYSAAWDTLNKGLSYMNQVFRRSSSEPYVMALREDMGVAEEKQLELLRSFANAKASKGEYGPQVMVAMVDEMNDLANHPWLRFGQRGMQAFDGFTQAVMANWEARGRAWDQVTQGGKVSLQSRKQSDDLAKNIYNQMFDENDNITDTAVRYAAGEISMSLDNAANDALSNLIRSAPVLKPFLLFTKTPLNMAKYFGTHQPLGVFLDQLNAFDRKFHEMSGIEVEQLLSSRGIDYSMDNIESVYNTVRAELKGRKALGAVSVMGAVGLFMSDNITGDGLYDKEKQRLRRDADWQKRSIRLPGGEWVSYDGIPGVSDWLALTVNIMDNFDSLNSAELAESLRAAGFVLSATITDKSMLAALEPLNDIVRGDVGAINRWTSSFMSSATMPGASLLSEFGRLMMPAKKELENNFLDLVANRNPILKQNLPDSYDWIDGGKVGVPANFFARVWNNYLPWKVSGSISPEKQFLIDIEYDARPTLRTNGRGVEYSNEERSEVMNLMGQQGLFKEAIQQVMQTQEGKEFRKEFKRAREANLPVDVESFKGIHMMLDSALRSSTRYAEAFVSTRDRIEQKQFQNQTLENFLSVGDTEGAEQFLKDFEQTMSY
jgi:hypothetical protein